MIFSFWLIVISLLWLLSDSPTTHSLWSAFLGCLSFLCVCVCVCVCTCRLFLFSIVHVLWLYTLCCSLFSMPSVLIVSRLFTSFMTSFVGSFLSLKYFTLLITLQWCPYCQNMTENHRFVVIIYGMTATGTVLETGVRKLNYCMINKTVEKQIYLVTKHSLDDGKGGKTRELW